MIMALVTPNLTMDHHWFVTKNCSKIFVADEVCLDPGDAVADVDCTEANL